MTGALEVLQWVAAVVFIGIAVLAVVQWRKHRDRAEAHLAWAMGLFGAAVLSTVIVGRVYPATPARLFPPQLVRIITPILIVVSLYLFLIFLSDFVRFRWWAHGAAALGTAGMVALSATERPDIALVNLKIVHVDVNNLMDFTNFVKALYIYLAIGFGILAVVFGIYALRVSHAARVRMIATSIGFFLLFVSSGIVPRILIGRATTSMIQWIMLVNWGLIVASAPLLFVGFTPPQWFRRRATGGPTAHPRAA